MENTTQSVIGGVGIGDFVGNDITLEKLDKTKLNLVVSGCGTGKTYFFALDLFKLFPGIPPTDVLFVTSRAIAVDQQANQYDKLIRLLPDDDIIDYWKRGVPPENPGNIRITTYDKLNSLLYGATNSSYDCHALDNIKVVIFDEIHSVFTDTFIDFLKVLQMWMSTEIPKGDKYFFGVTATPGILFECAPGCGIPLNIINEPMYRYKVKHIWCVDTDEMIRLIKEELRGKTIVMCRHSRTCYWLQKQLPGSVVLTSKHGEDYIACNMSEVRRSIVHDFSLPKDVVVLIATETIREGFTFVKKSGIRNVVSFFPDEMNIHQFVGRCRYDVDNLLVVKTKNSSTKTTTDGYFGRQKEMFDDFCFKGDHAWFETIRDITDINPEDVKIVINNIGKSYHKAGKPQEANPSISKYRNKGSEEALKKYIRKKWITAEGETPKLIYGNETKESILKDIESIKVFNDEANVNSWVKLEKVLKDIGFEVVNTRQRIDGQRVRCKTIREVS